MTRSAARPRAAAQNGAALAESTLEILLQIWDEMDDWLAACRQALKRTLT